MPEKKLHTVGIIPARFSSSRLPGKPLINLCGKTLLQRTWENSQKFSCLNQLIIATDDKRIFDHAIEFGAEVVMTSQGCKNGTERLAEVIASRIDFQNADYVFNIQGDEPLLDPYCVETVLKETSTDSSASIGTACVKIKNHEDFHNPSVVKCVLNKMNHALYFSRSAIPFNRDQIKEHDHYPLFRHIGIYCYTPKFLLESLQLKETPLQQLENLEQLKFLEHGYQIKVAVLDESKESIGVDTLQDIIKIERLLQAKL
jgi:3-deoxy-manno-octulosonate cytidylyltransferase (CMP-KDO synthetase)